MTDDVYARYREALRLGHQEASEGHFAQALTLYQTAADLATGRALPLVGVGSMNLRLGRARDALVAYERALSFEPTNLDALTGRAAALLAAGRRDEAARVQQQIIDIRDGGPPAAAPAFNATPTSVADALYMEGDQALRRHNNDAAIDAWLGESREHAGATRFDAALDATMRALAIDPSSARVHLEMARLYFARGWVEQGVERALLLDRLLALEPDPRIQLALRSLAAANVESDDRLATLAGAHAGAE
ncbi:MAG TPA: tetratricopeptide repeat protein [Candidatus Limnocylindrales bacterium]|nr:tetratricopeptide repeat protein [Candidatus Limnocylindrales bacterium]